LSAAADRPQMSETDLKDVVREFLDGAERAFEEYDQGYADADATLSVLRSQIVDLDAELE
jgi:predicted lipid-binding transport protein (Tim44 family)